MQKKEIRDAAVIHPYYDNDNVAAFGKQRTKALDAAGGFMQPL